MKSDVSTAKIGSGDIDAAVRDAVGKLGGLSGAIDLREQEKVLIKPNLTLEVPKKRRACTNPETLRAVINLVKKAGGIPIVGESSMVDFDTLKAFEKSGTKAVCEETGTKYMDFDRCEPIRVSIRNGKFIKDILLAREALLFDKIISLPVLKTHVLTGVTLGLKNMKGMQQGEEKIKFHKSGMRDLHRGIVDLNSELISDNGRKTIRPDLTIIDGSYGQQGEGPIGGDVVKMDLIIAGTDPVAVDATGCRVMGIEPKKIGHIRMAAERGLGQMDRITVVGNSIEEVKRRFEYPLSGLQGRFRSRFFDIGMKILAKLKGTTEEERANRIAAEVMQTKPTVTSKCVGCEKCIDACPVNAITLTSDSERVEIDYNKCTGCLICVESCPLNAMKVSKMSLSSALKEFSVLLGRSLGKALVGKLKIIRK